jgi:hypothetical protein
MESTLKLFKALPVKDKRKATNKALMQKTIPLGFIFTPEVIANYSNYDELIKMVEKVIGLSGEKMNSAFHQSWKKIKKADLEQLVVEQIAHYATTYGKENPALYLEEKGMQWGVDDLSDKVGKLDDIESNRMGDKDYVYIPKEILNIPDIDVDGIKLIVIRGYTKEEFKKKLLSLLESGIALKEDTIASVVDVALFVELSQKDVLSTRNKEVRIILCDYLDIIPEEPIEFLRFAVYKSVNKTLLIKNEELLKEIKSKDNINLFKLFTSYDSEYGLARLAEIFYRFKPIFLAFRTNRKMKTIVNKIRKLAVVNHKPMAEDFLNNVTAKLKKKEDVVDCLEDELGKVNIFRKIRLAYALKFRTKKVDSILYRIRNGKGYASDFNFKNKKGASEALDIVLDSIADDISKNVKGKKVYIPKNIQYSLPATEKQFTGCLPSGTCVSIDKDMIFGVHWDKVGEHRIDLDLSLISASQKFGWDSSYRSEERDILFSGDVTDAPKPNGASELFYVGRQPETAYVLFVNNYTFESDVEVPFSILVAKERVVDFKRNYMVNPNNVLITTSSKMTKRQKMLGLIVPSSSGCKFYFAEADIDRKITSSVSTFSEHSRKYLFDFYEDTINLNDVLVKAGAIVISKKEGSDIDLSPETLEVDSIMKLLR